MNDVESMNIVDCRYEQDNLVVRLSDVQRHNRRVLEDNLEIAKAHIDVQTDLGQLQHVVRRAPVDEAILENLILLVAESAGLFLHFDVVKDAVCGAVVESNLLPVFGYEGCWYDFAMLHAVVACDLIS